MEIAMIGLVVAGALALMYFTRKKEGVPPDEVVPPKVEPTPIVQPYPEGIEDWRREMWEGMRWKHWSNWTEEEWQSLRLTYGDPGYQEAYIKHYGQAAWDELMLKRQQYEASQAKHAAAEAEVDEFLEDVKEAGYIIEDGISEAYFTDLYGPAWAWNAGTPGRVEAMREYFLANHPNRPLPKELEPTVAEVPEPLLPTESVIETPTPLLPIEPTVLKHKVTFTDGSVGYYTADQINYMHDNPGFYPIKSVEW